MATLKLYSNGGIFHQIEGYSVVKSLLFDLVAQTPTAELAPCEKLFVVHSVGLETHPGYLADVHMACGCFSEVRKHYLKPEHPRKLGDVCWCEGDLEGAESYYSNAVSEAQFYRAGPDDDRLIKLAFYREQWEKVVSRFCEGNFSPGFLAGQVCIGRSHTAAAPYFQMLACAIVCLGVETPAKAIHILQTAFGISADQWKAILQSDEPHSPKTVAKLKKRCRPKLGAQTPSSVADALRKGDTARGRLVAAYIQTADESLEKAQVALEKFAATGNEVELSSFLGFVTGSGVESISRSFLFAALGHDSFPAAEIPSARLMRLLASHPIMNRRHFGTLLDLRFKQASPLTGEDVLTGLFQSIGRIQMKSARTEGALTDVSQLASCREWARVRLEEWVAGKAGLKVDRVSAVWREGSMTAGPSLFTGSGRAIIKTPRDTQEWDELMASALGWLRARWSHEIGASPWIAENQLFQLLRRQLKGIDVLQHARPTWIEPQHLDIYIPSADLAVEYMGRQHFEPLGFFGGEAAFQQLVERDRRKAELCRQHGIELVYVRYDEDLALRSKQTIERILSKAKK